MRFMLCDVHKHSIPPANTVHIVILESFEPRARVHTHRDTGKEIATCTPETRLRGRVGHESGYFYSICDGRHESRPDANRLVEVFLLTILIHSRSTPLTELIQMLLILIHRGTPYVNEGMVRGTRGGSPTSWGVPQITSDRHLKWAVKVGLL